MKTLLTALVFAGAATAALAQATPVGLWKTIDDKNKAERSFVRITESGGALGGKVEKILDPAKQGETCELCTDDRKGQRILGMTIIRGAKADAQGEHWEGGDILDPLNGKVYKLRLKPLDGGRKLEVRGYLGPFYRNQQWIRVE